MKFYAIAVGYDKENQELIYNKITTNWDEARVLVQGVSKKKDNVETVYKSCGSLKEANEYLDGIMKEALEKQTRETLSYEEVMSNRLLPDDVENTIQKKVEKQVVEKVNTDKKVVLTVEEVDLLTKKDVEKLEEISKESKDRNITEEVTVELLPEKTLEEDEIVVEKINTTKVKPVEEKVKKKKDSIDLYQAYTFRSYDEKTNKLAYGYSLVKNGVTMRTDSFMEKSKEPTFEGSRVYGTMLAIEKAIDVFKTLISKDENVIIMIHHLEQDLSEKILDKVPMDNGEYFFDWLKLLNEQYPHIKCDFSPIDLLFPEKIYIKLQINVKKKLLK